MRTSTYLYPLAILAAFLACAASARIAGADGGGGSSADDKKKKKEDMMKKRSEKLEQMRSRGFMGAKDEKMAEMLKKRSDKMEELKSRFKDAGGPGGMMGGMMGEKAEERLNQMREKAARGEIPPEKLAKMEEAFERRSRKMEENKGRRSAAGGGGGGMPEDWASKLKEKKGIPEDVVSRMKEKREKMLETMKERFEAGKITKEQFEKAKERHEMMKSRQGGMWEKMQKRREERMAGRNSEI